MATGQYTNAFRLIDRAVEQFPYSIRVRLAAHEVFRANGHTARAAGMLEEINQLAGRRDWAYRDPTNRVALGRAAILLGADPKKVLDLFFTPARKAAPRLPARHIWPAGELALRKNDFCARRQDLQSAAAETFPGRLRRSFSVIAQAFAPSDTEVMGAGHSARARNQHQPPRRAVAHRGQPGGRRGIQPEADEILKDIEKINPAHPDLWAYRAVLAHSARGCRSRVRRPHQGAQDVEQQPGGGPS